MLVLTKRFVAIKAYLNLKSGSNGSNRTSPEVGAAGLLLLVCAGWLVPQFGIALVQPDFYQAPAYFFNGRNDQDNGKSEYPTHCFNQLSQSFGHSAHSIFSGYGYPGEFGSTFKSRPNEALLTSQNPKITTAIKAVIAHKEMLSSKVWLIYPPYVL